jgi:hypothetical protein
MDWQGSIKPMKEVLIKSLKYLKWKWYSYPQVKTKKYMSWCIKSEHEEQSNFPQGKPIISIYAPGIEKVCEMIHLLSLHSWNLMIKRRSSKAKYMKGDKD